MLYLLDADVPIDANRYYYPVDRVPQLWDWLLTLGQGGQVEIPAEPANQTAISNETSKPQKIRYNRHIPDVCQDLGIRAINIFTLIQELNFRARQPPRPYPPNR